MACVEYVFVGWGPEGGGFGVVNGEGFFFLVGGCEWMEARRRELETDFWGGEGGGVENEGDVIGQVLVTY